ncbi:MAG: argininosuccinate lyase [Clostridia bacterium]|nr:argininosuccinate lyase [Clostridia bacterium]
MAKMWAGRTDGAISKEADDFNSSIHFDSRMYRQDITGSMAHATMLAACGILTNADRDAIVDGLQGILDDLNNGSLTFDPNAEDIHMFVEAELTNRIGDVGKRLHTARSRNDQVALDIRMYLRDEIAAIRGQIRDLVAVLASQAEKSQDAIMPGYTHLQRAQPITLAQHLLAYAMMLKRDDGRLADCAKRMNLSPLGACALAGTTYPINRTMTAHALGFDGATENSLDSVSDRDFCVELLSALSLCMTHLSRFSEEIILWSSWEFRFVELDDAYTTGSSIMPQKKNSDMAELVRGKTGRVFGDLVAMLTVLKGLPLAYNKDMQEDKEAVFDAVDTVKKCLGVFIPMIDTMKVKKENMYAAAQKGFLNATDLADYLVRKGLPFRSAYKTVGQLVAQCIAGGKTLESLTLDEYRAASPLFDEDLYTEISLETCIAKRISAGSTGPDAVAAQIASVNAWLQSDRL